MAENKVIRVAILDDDKDYRELLSGLLNKSRGFACIAAYKTAEEALRNIEADSPDVLLLDIEMPVKSGIECLKEIKFTYPTITVLMLTVYSDNERIFESLRSGADGYLIKKSPKQRLLEAISEAYEGGATFSGEVARKVLQYFRRPAEESDVSKLSQREWDVLNELIEGHTAKTIAEKLFVSTHTVRFHLHNIYVKLHVNSNAEAVAKAYRTKLSRP